MGWDGRFLFSLGFYLLHWLFLWPKVIVPSVRFVSNTLAGWDMERAAGFVYFGFGHPAAYWVMLVVEVCLVLWLFAWANKPDKKQNAPAKT